MRKIFISFVLFLSILTFTYLLLFNTITSFASATYQEANENPVKINEGIEVKKPDIYLPPFGVDTAKIDFEVLFWTGDPGNIGGTKGSDIRFYADTSPDDSNDVRLGTIEDYYRTDVCSWLSISEGNQYLPRDYRIYIGVYNDKEWFNNTSDYIRILFY